MGVETVLATVTGGMTPPEVITWLICILTGVLGVISFSLSRHKEGVNDIKESAKSMMELMGEIRVMTSLVNEVRSDTAEIKTEVRSMKTEIQAEHDMNIRHDRDINAQWKRIDEMQESLKDVRQRVNVQTAFTVPDLESKNE